MAVRFYLETHPNKEGEVSIKMAVTLCKKRFMPVIGYTVDPKVWDGNRVTKSKYINSRGITAQQINSDIFKLQSYFTDLEMKIEKVPTATQFKDHFKIALGQKMPRTKHEPKEHLLLDDLKAFIIQESASNQWAYATCQCWKTFTNHITDFDSKVKYEDFNEAGIDKFVQFLRVDCNMEEKTVQKQFNNLKWFLNWAIRKGYCKQDYINKYRPKFKVMDKPVIFLTREELLKLVPMFEIQIKFE